MATLTKLCISFHSCTGLYARLCSLTLRIEKKKEKTVNGIVNLILVKT